MFHIPLLKKRCEYSSRRQKIVWRRPFVLFRSDTYGKFLLVVWCLLAWLDKRQRARSLLLPFVDKDWGRPNRPSFLLSRQHRRSSWCRIDWAVSYRSKTQQGFALGMTVRPLLNNEWRSLLKSSRLIVRCFRQAMPPRWSPLASSQVWSLKQRSLGYSTKCCGHHRKSAWQACRHNSCRSNLSLGRLADRNHCWTSRCRFSIHGWWAARALAGQRLLLSLP